MAAAVTGLSPATMTADPRRSSAKRTPDARLDHILEVDDAKQDVPSRRPPEGVPPEDVICFHRRPSAASTGFDPGNAGRRQPRPRMEMANPPPGQIAA